MKMFLVLFIPILIQGRVNGVNDIQNLVDTITSEGSKLSTGIEKLASQCSVNSQNTEIMKILQNSLDLQRKVSDLELKVAHLESVLTQNLPSKSRRDINTIDSGDIYFSVASTKQFRCRDCTVTYTTTQVNRGGGMDMKTGVFTAPIAGSYYFQFHGMVEKGHEARVLMVLNDKVVMHMYDKDYSGNNERFAMFGQSIIVEMKVGDKFRIELNKGSLGVKGGQNHFISFLGHLVSSFVP